MPDVAISHEHLQLFITALLERSGLPPSSAALVSESLIAASLRGVDSHGVQLAIFYIDQMRSDNIDLHTRGSVVSEDGACVTYDANNGMGQVISAMCCDHAVRLANTLGMGMVVARDSNHFGAAAFWAQRIARHGMIGMTFCNATPIVLPWQGRDGRFGTNPICMALPGGRWLLDMATTTVAMGRIFKASLTGQPEIPAGWAMNAEGAPTTDTQAAMQGSPMPLGGYKGSGLAAMVEILCGVLGGGVMTTEVGGLRVKDRPMRVSQCFIAIDVARFMPHDVFEARASAFVDSVKSSRPAAGYGDVLVAGEPEQRTEAHRRAHGIPLNEAIWNQLAAIGDQLGVPRPPIQ